MALMLGAGVDEAIRYDGRQTDPTNAAGEVGRGRRSR